ncbi:MAG TPA: PEGA domain-containing protein [Kofleriaceae bacterium]|nr:PEGA domain-containing protein [Kofleriaceae bacterium]
MTRVLSSACVALVLLGVFARGATAWAGAKPTIAILGLEVYDNGSGIDPETTKAARELTAALRDRAKAGTGPYAPAPGGDKELIDEKLLNNCDTEAPACMAAIGTELSADLLMYGKIEKSSQNQQPIYKVSIKLLYVGRKQLASSLVETLPVAEATGVHAQTHARTWYGKLVSVTTGGTVIVTANTDRASVLIDGEAKGNLTSGSLTIPVPEGRHTLAIEAPGFQRYETQITVHTGDTVPHSATLAEMTRSTPVVVTGPSTSIEGTVSSGSPSNVWKPVFIGTAIAEAAAIGFTIYEWNQQNNNIGKIDRNGMFATGMDNKRLSNDDCGSSYVARAAKDDATRQDAQAFNDACTNLKRQRIGWVTTGVVGVAMVGAFYMAFFRDREHSDAQSARAGHKKRRELAITPIVTPDGGGATLRLDW